VENQAVLPASVTVRWKGWQAFLPVSQWVERLAVLSASVTLRRITLAVILSSVAGGNEKTPSCKCYNEAEKQVVSTASVTVRWK